MATRDPSRKNRLATPVFVFEDYVDYLKAWYGYAKRFRMTQSAFIERAGVGTQAYFSDILARRKKLAVKHINGFVTALELTGDAVDFFRLLVLKEHSKKGAEKEKVLKQLALLRERHLSTLITDGNAEYFSCWKYSVVREFIVSRGYVASLWEIKRAFLHFTMSIGEVRETVNKLIQWKMVEADSRTGGFRPAAGAATITYSGMPHAVVNDVKRLFIESSVHAMETLPRDQRHITMAIRGMSRENYKRFCRKIDELRAEFLTTEERAGASDYVYGITIQLFPVMSLSSDEMSDGEGRNGDPLQDNQTENR
ncbi:MAG: TIGR02147 family protein [Chitinispirillaceae bacterium]|nr:TIGR02147 family protein [Chitinispirillaceae bacterium]